MRLLDDQVFMEGPGLAQRGRRYSKNGMIE